MADLRSFLHMPTRIDRKSPCPSFPKVWWGFTRVGVLEGLPSESVQGFMREVMLVRVRVWGVHERLMTMGMC
jgi:hypothetical protein